MKLSLEERFWNKVNKTDECWNWIGCTDGSGYGQISNKGRLETASRISWFIHNGDIPKGLFVLHHCDNRICVRPDHLWIGTQKDNIQDAIRKGRMFFHHRFKTHCFRGHEYNLKNTQFKILKGRHVRACRVCEKQRRDRAKTVPVAAFHALGTGNNLDENKD